MDLVIDIFASSEPFLPLFLCLQRLPQLVAFSNGRANSWVYPGFGVFTYFDFTYMLGCSVDKE
jgi:hypothetical protein